MQEQPTVLFVSDNAELYLTLGAHLHGEYSYLHTASEEHALQAWAGSRNLVLALIDLDMPGIDAMALCEQMLASEIRAEVPVVVMAGTLSAEQVTAALSAGAVDCIEKLAAPALIDARIATQLDLYVRKSLLTEKVALDGLTCLSNRMGFEESLDIEWRRSLREFSPLSLIVFDIDHFTAFNEHYGMGTGKGCLKRLSRVISKRCKRAADVVARLGHDEFVAMLPGTELDNAIKLAESICQAVVELGIAHEHSLVADTVTVSAGVAFVEPSQQSSWRELLEEAEEMVVQARQMGGNRAQGIAL